MVFAMDSCDDDDGEWTIQEEDMFDVEWLVHHEASLSAF